MRLLRDRNICLYYPLVDTVHDMRSIEPLVQNVMDSRLYYDSQLDVWGTRSAVGRQQRIGEKVVGRRRVD